MKAVRRELLDVPFSLERRPQTLAADLRSGWRLPVLLLILARCRGNSASLQQLHVLMWAARSTVSQRTFLSALRRESRPSHAIVRFEPSVIRALDLAVGEGLATLDSARITLTDKGRQFHAEIQSDPELFVSQKVFLEDIGGKISQRMIQDILNWRRQG